MEDRCVCCGDVIPEGRQVCPMCEKEKERQLKKLSEERKAVPAMWKEDNELGYAYVCSKCHRFVCASGECKCGAYVDLRLPKEHYDGKVRWN